MNTQYKKDSNVIGILVIIMTVFAMSFADAIVKYVSSELPLWQIYVVRSLIAIPIISVVFFGKNEGNLSVQSMKWVILRSLLLTFMYVAIYAATPILSLSVIGASLYTGPLFITLFSAFIIGDSVSYRQWVAIFFGLAGVLLIIRPDTDEFSLAMLIPILAAIFYALAAVLTQTKCAQEKPLILALALNYSLLFIGIIFSGLIILWKPADSIQSSYPFLLGYWIDMGAHEWTIISLLAFLIVGIGIGLAKAYQSGQLAVIATFDYSYLIFAAMWGVIFFSDWPDERTVIGMIMIILSGVLVTKKQKLAKLPYSKHMENDTQMKKIS